MALPPSSPDSAEVMRARKMARLRVTYESSHAALAEKEAEAEVRAQVRSRRRNTNTEEVAVARLWTVGRRGVRQAVIVAYPLCLKVKV